MRTLHRLSVMACLAVAACGSREATQTAAQAPPPTPVSSPATAVAAAPSPKSGPYEVEKRASCAALRGEVSTEKALRVVATLEVSLEDQAVVDAAHEALQAQLPEGSASELQVMGASLVATVQVPALEALCASPQVLMVVKPQIGRLN